MQLKHKMQVFDAMALIKYLKLNKNVQISFKKSSEAMFVLYKTLLPPYSREMDKDFASLARWVESN